MDEFLTENKVLATQRGYEVGWEFPGGKIEEGEAPQETLVREMKKNLI